jgi:GT2 family glycosyltransferase
MNERQALSGIGDYIDCYGFGYSLGYKELDVGQYDQIIGIFSAKTACAVVRRDVFKQVTGFDDDFYLEAEDVDLGWRIRLLGYKVVPAPFSVVCHFSGGTREKQHTFSVYHATKNHLAMLIKNYSSRRLSRTLPSVVAIYSMILLWNLKQKDTKTSLGYLRGLLWPTLHAKTLYKKRMYVQSTRQVQDAEIAEMQVPSKILRDLILRLEGILFTWLTSAYERLRG